MNNVKINEDGGIVKRLLALVKDPSIKVKSTITDFLAPQRVWLKIDERAKILVSKKEILKSDPLFSLDDKVYYSPISGKIKNIDKRLNEEGKESLFLQVLNDYQESDHYAGVDFTTTIIEPTLQKKILNYEGYDWNKIKGKKSLVLNGIEDEVYLANRPFLHKYYSNEILLMLDAIAHTFGISVIKICVKENDRESIEAFQTVLSTYPDMQLVILPDVYPIGNEVVLRNYLHLSEEDKIVSTEEIFDLYHEIIKARRKDFILVTLTGDAVSNPQVVRVKIGTELQEVASEVLHFQKDDYEVYVNGLMCGVKSQIKQIILDEHVRAVYFMSPVVHEARRCEGCGKCNLVCPVGCRPYHALLSKGKEGCADCIHCGLCSFICPSYIDLAKVMAGDSNE